MHAVACMVHVGPRDCCWLWHGSCGRYVFMEAWPFLLAHMHVLCKVSHVLPLGLKQCICPTPGTVPHTSMAHVMC
jgi:hypothetical protein